jgi:hypothetical protein
VTAIIGEKEINKVETEKRRKGREIKKYVVHYDDEDCERRIAVALVARVVQMTDLSGE